VEIGARTAAFEAGMANVKRQLASVGEAFSRFGRQMTMRVTLPLIGIATVALREFAKQEQAEAKLAAVLKATGYAAGFAADQLKAQAAALQTLTGVGDDTIINAQAIMATFKQIKGDVFTDATKAALDMSTVLGQDLQSSVMLLARALNEPAVGLTYLRRAGVSFTEEQQKQIKVLAESGRLMEAQRIILQELQSEFGGAAEAAGKTFAGQLRLLKATIGDLLETVVKVVTGTTDMGAAVGKVTAKITGMIDAVKGMDPETVQNWVRFGVALIALAPVAMIIGTLTKAIHGLTVAATWLMANPIAAALLLAAAGATALYLAVRKANSAVDQQARAFAKADEEARAYEESLAKQRMTAADATRETLADINKRMSAELAGARAAADASDTETERVLENEQRKEAARRANLAGYVGFADAVRAIEAQAEAAWAAQAGAMGKGSGNLALMEQGTREQALGGADQERQWAETRRKIDEAAEAARNAIADLGPKEPQRDMQPRTEEPERQWAEMQATLERSERTQERMADYLERITYKEPSPVFG